MKKLIVLSVLLLLIIICFASVLLPRYFFEIPFQKIATEVKSLPDYYTGGTLYTADREINISQLCQEQNKEYSLDEVFCVTNEKVYFVYTDPSETTLDWVIASIELDTLLFTELFRFVDTQTVYRCNPSSAFNDRNGYYYKGQIILNNLTTVLVYDIGSNTASWHNYNTYTFPFRPTYGAYVDAYTINLYTEGFVRTYTLQEMAQNSDSIAQLYALNDNKTWDGASYLSFFHQKSVQVIEDEVYAVGAARNFSGEIYAVILKYNSSNDSWVYVHTCFADYIGHCYLITRVE